MKRGWITWDKAELHPSAFESRLEIVRNDLVERDLPALVVYTDVFRSNEGRYYSNFMPYWNRALLLIPRDGAPVLLCGLSPRVYPWIRSVTILEDIKPSPNLARQLLEVCAAKGWNRIGVMDLLQVPYDLYQQIGDGSLELVDVPFRAKPDTWEILMYKEAARLAREGLTEDLAGGIGMLDHEFTGRLERKFRSAGAEDLVILLTNGQTPPVPARGVTLGENFSVALALEYRGHWAKVARSANGDSAPPVPLEPAPRDAKVYVESLLGSYPYEPGDQMQEIVAIRTEVERGGRRLFHGDTYLRRGGKVDLL